jgi:mannose-6-phosphate isomerase-like protein (cupin superfamily)
VSNFDTMRIPAEPDVVATDGGEVRVLLSLAGGSMAHFQLAGGETSVAVCHHSVEEIWYCIGGRGEMWRRQGDREEVVAVAPGVCITIPVGTEFQWRSTGDEPLASVAITMPPWPGPGEAYPVEGKWPVTVVSGEG